MESEKMPNLTTADWKKLHGFIDVLEPFEMATKTAEGEKYLTLSAIIPMQSILRDKTTAYSSQRSRQKKRNVFNPE